MVVKLDPLASLEISSLRDPLKADAADNHEVSQ